MESSAQAVERTFRQESGQILAALIGTVGDFTLAEDALQDALVIALQRWPTEGVPRNPPAWLTTIARRKAIDLIRRDAALSRKQELLAALAALDQADAPERGDGDAAPITDER